MNHHSVGRWVCISLIALLILGCMPVQDGLPLLSPAKADSAESVPPAYALEEAELGEEETSGPWRYALRLSDGYAVITGYNGTDREVTVPSALGGHDVVGLASHALPDASRVMLHGNILYLAEDAFGENHPHVTSLNGTYGLYWASTHECKYDTGKDYELVPGVIDFTDAPSGRVRKYGEDYVVFGRLEAKRLSAGSLIWVKDARNMEFFYRVTSLAEKGDQVLASVTVPDRVADVIRNYETTVEIALTQDDFVPADGVMLDGNVPSGKSVINEKQEQETSFSVELEGKVKGKNDITGSSGKYTGKVSMKTNVAVIYTVRVVDGEIVATELTKKQTYTKTLSVTCALLTDKMKAYQDSADALEKASSGEQMSEEEARILETTLGIKVTKPDGSGVDSGAWKDIKEYGELLEKYREEALSSCHVEETKELGSFKLQSPYFNFSIDLVAKVSVNGNITYTESSTNVTREHYDFAKDEWVVDYSRGSASTDENEKSLQGEIKGKFTIGAKASVGVFFFKNFSLDLDFGIEASVSKRISAYKDAYESTGERVVFGCSDLWITPVMSIEVYAGVWAGDNFGVKNEILKKEWTAEELCGNPYIMHAHVNLGLKDNKLHLPEECPVEKTRIIRYETKTGVRVESRNAVTGDVLTKDFNVDMNELVGAPFAGRFLGWAWDASDTTPTAAETGGTFTNPDGTGPVLVRQDIMLYAVWADSCTIHFDSQGGKSVPDQSVPAGGFVIRPQIPDREDAFLLGWRDESGKEWSFEHTPVTGDMTLYAWWGGEARESGGTDCVLEFGSRSEVSAECIFNPYEAGPTDYTCFQYRLIDGAAGFQGIEITGLQNDPVHLVVPGYLPIFRTGQEPLLYKVVNIASGAFSNCKSLKSAYFLTGDTEYFKVDSLFKNCSNLEYVELPSLENGVVGNSVFSGCTNLKCVVMWPGVKAIGEQAFAGTAISNCYLPSGIATLGEYAFSGCTSLSWTNVEQSDILRIPDGAFQNCTSLQSMRLGTRIVSVGDYAFKGCTSIARLDLGNVVTIGAYAFDGCTGLEELYIPDSVQELEVDRSGRPGPYGGISGYYRNGPFIDCTGLKRISVGGVRTLEAGMLKTGSQVLEKLTIRGTVKKIAVGAFSSKWAYTRDAESYGAGYDVPTASASLVIEEGVEEIDSYAFEQCTMFTSVSLPSSIRAIGTFAFTSCYRMEGSLDLHNMDSIGEQAFSACSRLKSVTLSDVGYVDYSAFSGCSGILSIRLHNVDTLRRRAFSGCSNLSRLDLGNVKIIESSAFKGCESLTELYIPDSVQELEVDRAGVPGPYGGTQGYYSNGPFIDCTGLKVISVGGIRKLESGMLKTGSQVLEKLIIRGSVKVIGNAALSSSSAYTTDGSTNGAGYDTDGVSASLVIEEGVEEIGSYAFTNCRMFTSISLPDTISTIEYAAFAGCSRWEGVLELHDLTSIPGSAFSGCASLSTVSLTNIDKLEERAFASCSGLSTVRLNHVDTVSVQAFYACQKLTQLEMENVRAIETEAFGMCTSLTDLYIPDSVRELGVNRSGVPGPYGGISGYHSEGPFVGCTGLRRISIGGVETLETGMLKTGSQVLESLTVRGSVKKIAAGAFSSNYDYKTDGSNYGAGYRLDTTSAILIIEEGVEQIGDMAFEYCTAFTTVSLPASLKSIGYFAFRYCARVKDLFFFAGNASVGELAFGGMGSLTTVHFGAAHADLQAYCDAKDIQYDMIVDIPCTLTLHGCGGTIDGHELTAVEAALMSRPELPVPVWEEHVFSGWYTDEGFDNQWNGMVSGNDIQLYACWDRDIYTLTLNAMGGTLSRSAWRVHAGDEVVPEEPVRDGFCFVGWTLDETGEHGFDGRMPGQDITIYALWHPWADHGLFRVEEDGAVLLRCELTDNEPTDVCLPESVQGKPLRKIAGGAFADSGVRSVWIPASVTDIEPGAFADCDTLSKIMVSENNPVYRSLSGLVYSKDGSRLLFCPPTGVWHVSVPEGVTAVSERAFEKTDVTGVDLPSTLVDIGSRAFRGTRITEIILPAALKTVGERAFAECGMLSRIEAAGSPEELGEQAFSGCHPFMCVFGPDEDCPLKTAIRTGGYMYNAHQLTLHYAGKTKNAFLQAGDPLMMPENPDMGENLELSGWYLDEACEVPFSDSVMPNADLSLWAGVQAVFTYETEQTEETSTVRITGCHTDRTEVVIPDSLGGAPVTAIAAGSFGEQYRRVTVPASVTVIEENAFCQNTVLICDAGSYAQAWAAEHAIAVEERTFILSWDSGYEKETPSLQLHSGEALVLPVPVRSGYTFLGWFWDKQHKVPAGNDDAMPAQDTTLYAGWEMSDQDMAGLVADLTWVTEDSEIIVTGYAGSAVAVVIPEMIHGQKVKGIGDEAFAYHQTVTSVTLPDTVRDIGRRAFFNMRSLKQVVLPESLSVIPDEAFSGCASLRTLDLPEGIREIGQRAFCHTGMERLILPSSLTVIHPTALLGCDGLREILVTEGNPYYESRDGVLYDTAENTLVRYPPARAGTVYTVSDAGAIGPWAFQGASGLAEIVLSEDVYSLGEGAFDHCTALNVMPDMGEMIRRIPAQCFYGCSSMTSAVFRESLLQIDSQAFVNTGLAEVTLPDSVNTIGSLAFGKTVVLHGGGTGYACSWAKDNGYIFVPDNAILPERLFFEPESLTIGRGEHETLWLSAEPENATLEGVVFYSGDESIARVDENGTVFAVSTGDTCIYALAPGGAVAICYLHADEKMRDKVPPMIGSYTLGSISPWDFCIDCTVTENEGLESLWCYVYTDEILQSGSEPIMQGIMLEEPSTEWSGRLSLSLENLGTTADQWFYVYMMARDLAGNETVAEDYQVIYMPTLDRAEDHQIRLPSALKAIDDEAFEGLGDLYEVILPWGVERIGSRAFAGCEGLVVIYIPDTVTDIAEDAFDDSWAVTICCDSVDSPAAVWARNHDRGYVTEGY